jgi:hypothetical protein
VSKLQPCPAFKAVDDKDFFGGGLFEIKINLPCHAEMILLFSWESIVKVLSSAGIRSNKKTHVNCGSSARPS